MSLQGYATVNGTEATLVAATLGTYDPETGTATDTDVNQTVHLISAGRTVDESGGDVDVNHRRYLIPAGEVTTAPTTEHHITIGSQVWEIQTVKPVEKRGSLHFYHVDIVRVK
jgi:hypothetical protein